MKRISWKNYGCLQSYFQNRTEILRFASIPTFLIKFKYQYEIKDEVLFLYREGSMFGNKFRFLGFPPLSKQNNYGLEETMLREKLHEIPVILSSEEIKRYNISRKDYKFTPRLIEYYCHLNDYCDIGGKSWRSWRRAVKRVDEDFNTIFISSEDKYKGLLKHEVLEVAKEWSETNIRYGGLNLYIEDFFEGRLQNSVLMILTDKTENIRQYKITQKISPSTVFMVDSKSVISGNRYNLMKASFLKTLNLWRNTDPNIIFNLGSGKEKGYKEAKESLRPEKLRLFKVEPK